MPASSRPYHTIQSLQPLFTACERCVVDHQYYYNAFTSLETAFEASAHRISNIGFVSKSIHPQPVEKPPSWITQRSRTIYLDESYRNHNLRPTNPSLQFIQRHIQPPQASPPQPEPAGLGTTVPALSPLLQPAMKRLCKHASSLSFCSKGGKLNLTSTPPSVGAPARRAGVWTTLAKESPLVTSSTSKVGRRDPSTTQFAVRRVTPSFCTVCMICDTTSSCFVIENSMGSEPLQVRMVLAAGGGVDGKAQRFGGLDHEGTDAACTAPDQNRLFVLRRIPGIEGGSQWSSSPK